MRYFVTVDDRTFEVELDGERVTLDGRPVHADLHTVRGSDVHSLLLDGSSERLVARGLGRGRWDLRLRGTRLAAEVVDERTRAIREMTGAAGGPTGPEPVRAPMPGLVVRMEVAEGDDVRAGQGLVIVEAMKMENELRAEVDGRVRSIRVAPGEAVEKDQVLIEFESPDAGPAADGDGEAT